MTRTRNPKADPDSGQFDAEHVVATHWPRTYTANRLRAAMQTIGELVRWANHATLNAPAETLESLDDAASVLRNLATALAGAQQLVEQVGREVHRKAKDGLIYHDAMEPADRWETHGRSYAVGTADGARLALDVADRKLAETAHALKDATGLLSHLGHLDPEDRPEDRPELDSEDVDLGQHQLRAVADEPRNLRIVRDGEE